MSGNDFNTIHLKNSTLLNSVPDDIVSHLSQRAEYLTIKAGETVFNRGDHANSMYIVTNGSLYIHDGEVLLKTISSGESFGEIGALASESRTATVTARLDSELLKIDQQDIYSGLLKFPGTAKYIIKALCEKGRGIIQDEAAYAIKADALQKELEIAHSIQRSFLPDVIPDCHGWKFIPYLKPAKTVAGDFYDFFTLPNTGLTAFVIADVCDKGLSAALFMTLFRTLINSSLQFQDNSTAVINKNPATMLQNSIAFTNHYISLTHGKSNMFASLFAGVLDTSSGKLTYINAGHEPPVIVSQSGIRQHLETTGPIVGMFPNAEYDTGETHIEPTEVFVAYTDGVTETKNCNNDFFTEDGLYRSIESSSHSADAIFKSIIHSIEEFSINNEQYDDTTIIIIEREKH